MRRAKKNRGSFTVEMTILFPAIFFVILGILNMCIIHYQNIAASSAAMRAAARTASYWEYADGRHPAIFQDISGAQMINNDSFTEHDPYRYIFDTKSGTKQANASAYASKLIGDLPKLVAEHEDISTPVVTKSGNLFEKYVTVTVERKDTVPLSSLFKKFGITIRTENTITAKARLNNPGEFVRNMSFVFDTAKEWSGK